MPSRNARVILSAKDRASKTILTVQRSLKGLGVLVAAFGGFALARGLVRQTRAAVKVFAEWDKQMSATAAILRLQKNQVQELAQQSKELGATTQFTARQAAEAQTIFAKAGFEVNEIYGAMPGTLNLAAAAETSIAQAADISAGIIRGWGLDASAAADVADILATAATSANTTIEELGDALKFAAPAATALGLSVGDTSAALDILADNMLKGTLGGTGLRTMMATLLGQVNKLEGATGLQGLEERLFEVVEVNGVLTKQFIGMVPALRIMKDAGIDTGKAYEIFGKRAGGTAGILLKNIERLEQLQEEIGNERLGRALQVAQDRMNNLQGDSLRLKSAFEGLQLVIGEKLDTGLRTLTQQLTDVISQIVLTADEGNHLIDVFEKLGVMLASVGQAAVVSAQVINLSYTGVRGAVLGVTAAILQSLTTIVDQAEKTMAALDFIDPTMAAQAMSGALAGVKAQLIEVTGEIVKLGVEGVVAGEERDRSLAALEERILAIKKALEALAATPPAPRPEPEPSPEEEPGPGVIPSPDEARTAAQQVADARIQVLQAQLAVSEGLLREQKRIELEIQRIQHAEELLAVEGNLEAERLLREAHLQERKNLEDSFRDATMDAIREQAQFEIDEEARKRAVMDNLRERTKQQAFQTMRVVFGRSKKSRIAAALISTFAAVNEALAFPPGPPATLPMAALTLAMGLANVQRIRKQKFQRGGIVEGPPGIDRVTVGGAEGRFAFTAGELVADTTAAEGRAILGGRAAIVPVDSAVGGRTVVVQNLIGELSALDGESARDVLLANRESILEALLLAEDEGALVERR